MAAPKIAIVHDWLTNMGGAEKVVLALHDAFPDAPIYTSTFAKDKMPEFAGLDIRTTQLQNLPGILKKMHKFFPMQRVRAFRDLDLSEFDIIISSSSAEAKQVRKTRPDQVHICYCHTPIRYYWSHYEAAQNVDVFVANSSEVQKRIKKYYDRNSTVIHPPVDVDRFNPARSRADYYVTLGRQVHYKRIDLAVSAATELNIPLKVYGNGSEHQQLVKIAGPTVEFYTDRFSDASDAAVTDALNNAKGFIYPAEEDFGIVQVEALAAGAPVIALGRGGAKDIVEDSVSGVLFRDQNPDSISNAIRYAKSHEFLPGTLRRKAKRFDKSLFITKIRKVVLDSYPGRKG